MEIIGTTVNQQLTLKQRNIHLQPITSPTPGGGIARRYLRLIVMATIMISGAIVGCRDFTSPAPTRGPKASSDGAYLFCVGQFTPEQCNAIFSALDALQDAALPQFCHDLASDFYSKLQWDLVRYTYPPQDYGGYRPGSGIIDLSDWAFGAGELMNTMTHEASHDAYGTHDIYNPDDSTSAYYYGARCTGVW